MVDGLYGTDNECMNLKRTVNLLKWRSNEEELEIFSDMRKGFLLQTMYYKNG